MIGLVDFDLQKSDNIRTSIPNLQIMKLATYYRTEENIFCRLISLQETELSAYEKIYFFSEANRIPSVPEPFLNAKNVIYGGPAFTMGKYIPFQNEIIDYTIAKPYIYKDFLKKKYEEGEKIKNINGVLDNSYYRMYANDKKLPIPPIIPKKRIYIYDLSIFYSDWQDILTQIADHRPSGIFCIHPIKCKTITQYKQIRNMPKFSRTNQIILDLNIPLNEVYYLLKEYKNMFLADICNSSSVSIPIGGNYKTSTLYKKDLVYKLNLLYSFWSKGIMIKLNYQQPMIGYNDPLFNLSKKIEQWANGEGKNKKTINEAIARKGKKITLEQQQRNSLLEGIPSSSDLFDQTLPAIIKRRFWKI